MITRMGSVIGGIGPAEAILDVKFVALPESQHLGVEGIEFLFGDRLIDLPPVHSAFGDVVAHHELVFRRAAGEWLGANHQRSSGGEQAFMAADGVLDELRRAQIPVGDGDIANAVLVEAITAG